MASNSFKVKNSLVLTPKDLSTLTSPEPGDLACDINDNNKIKRYDQERADWVEVGSGGGGGLDVFYSENVDDLPNVTSFDKGNNASFMGGGTMAGTFSFEEINPISGLKSLKYIQAASGSLNDYFASDFIDIDPKQQGKTCGLTLYFNYNGDNGDGRFVVFDATNNQEISNQLALVENTGGQASRYSLSFTVPPSCNQIRWGYQVLVENSGADLLVDDVEMSSDPFVSAELFAPDSSIRVDTANGYGSVGTKIRRFSNVRDNLGNDIQYVPSATDGDSFVAMKSGIFSISYTENMSSAGFFGVSKNASSLSANITGTSTAERLAFGSITAANLDQTISTGEIYLVAGDVIRAHTNGESTGAAGERARLTISKVGKNSESILTPSDTFSTDTAPLTYAPSSQYTLSTLENAPVGTFITFTYAANTNTRTQTTTAPSQSTADMNANGIRIFTRAFNAASTSGNPSAIAIQIGKGLKGLNLGLYKSASKTTSGSVDFIGLDAATVVGAYHKDYDEKTGILFIDAGFVPLSTNTNHPWAFTDATTQNNGYLTINASRKLPLLAVPIPQTAYLKDVKPSGTAGGTFTSGSWQTRTLNTEEGDFNKFGTLSGNQFTLQPGTYEIEASAPGYTVGGHKIKLRNITDSSDLVFGSSDFNSAGNNVQTLSKLQGNINLTSLKVFEIQHRCQVTKSTDGFGVPTTLGVDEVYTICKITRLG